MAKDPAFLFYSSDFISGTQFFSNEQIGMYMRLLCAQHQHGRLSEQQVLFICNSLDNEVVKKFAKDDSGLYYNLRLEDEILKRKRFSESRANNRLGKTKDVKKQVKKKSKSYVKHMENENRDENINRNKEKSALEIAIENFKKMRIRIRKPMADGAEDLLMKKLEQLAPGDTETQIKILEQSILNSYQGVFPLKTDQKETFTTQGKKYDTAWEPK